MSVYLCFFFQAEDGIRDLTVTGVQTCALPIYDAHQPFYDGSEGKKTESRGTEAVLNALILSSADAERGRREPSEPTRKALRRPGEGPRPAGGVGWVHPRPLPARSARAACRGPHRT